MRCNMTRSKAAGDSPTSSSMLTPSSMQCCSRKVWHVAPVKMRRWIETVPGVNYTVIETRDDEVVTPYTNAFLPAAPNVSNITLQNQCPLDASDHLEQPG